MLPAARLARSTVAAVSEHDIAMAQAEIAARDARIAELEVAIATRTRERDEARALLAHIKTSLNERHNDPMQDGGSA